MRAKYIGTQYDNKGYRVDWFSYKNHTYCVCDNTEFTRKEQHAQEQCFIDGRAEIDGRMKANEGKNPASVGIQQFFDYLDNK